MISRVGKHKNPYLYDRFCDLHGRELKPCRGAEVWGLHPNPLTPPSSGLGMASGHVIGDVIARRIRPIRYSAERSGIRTRVRPDLYSEVYLYCLDEFACCAHQHRMLVRREKAIALLSDRSCLPVSASLHAILRQTEHIFGLGCSGGE